MNKKQILIIFLVFFSVSLDNITTMMAISKPNIYEANPFKAYIIYNHPWLILLEPFVLAILCACAYALPPISEIKNKIVVRLLKPDIYFIGIALLRVAAGINNIILFLFA